MQHQDTKMPLYDSHNQIKFFSGIVSKITYFVSKVVETMRLQDLFSGGSLKKT